MQNITETINFLVKQKINFAIYSLPNTSDISLVVSENKTSKPTAGFAIQEFNIETKTYFIAEDIVLQNNEIVLSKVAHCTALNENNLNTNNCKEFSKREYEEYVNNCVEACKTTELKKVVPTRIKIVDKPLSFNVGEYFLKLVKEYKTAFVHLYSHNNSGLWIGATPELLIKQVAENNYETNSLAGTKLKSKNRAWTTKEKEEQQIVTDYIVNSLESEKCDIKSGLTVKTIDAGIIQHLKTNITFSSTTNFNELAKILHPTPAVCGLPLKDSYKFIKAVEMQQRKCYTGFVGLHTNTTKQYFVNLRCMQILDEKLHIHIGAGVTKDSIPEKEWQETENKSLTMLRLV